MVGVGDERRRCRHLHLRRGRGVDERYHLFAPGGEAQVAVGVIGAREPGGGECSPPFALQGEELGIVAAQVDEAAVEVMEGKAARVGEPCAPVDYLGVGVVGAVGVLGGLIVGQLAELPYHLWPRGEQHLHSKGAEARIFGVNVGLDRSYGVGVDLESDALLVVALGVGYGRACGAAAVGSGEEAAQVAVALIAHGILARGIVDVCPVDLAVIAHGRLLLGAGEVLVDMNAVGLHRLDDGMQARHAVDAALIVEVGAGCRCIAVVVAEALDEVEAEAVGVILLHPIAQGVGPLLLYERVALVPVVEHAVGMRGGDVVERIAAGGVHLIPRMEAVALVEYDVENHGNAAAVALLYEVLIVAGRPVSLVGSHVEIGVVAP